MWLMKESLDVRVLSLDSIVKVVIQFEEKNTWTLEWFQVSWISDLFVFQMYSIQAACLLALLGIHILFVRERNTRVNECLSSPHTLTHTKGPSGLNYLPNGLPIPQIRSVLSIETCLLGHGTLTSRLLWNGLESCFVTGILPTVHPASVCEIVFGSPSLVTGRNW